MLNQEFGKSGQHYFNIVRGLQKSSVKPNRTRKSIGAETTLSTDINNIKEMEEVLQKVMASVKKRIDSSEAKGKTVTLKIKDFDFEQHTRSFSFGHYTNDEKEMGNKVLELLNNPAPTKAVRLLGITLSNFKEDEKREIYLLIQN